MEIKRCESESEIKELAQLAAIIWNEYFVDIISKEQIAYMIEKFQSYPALKKAMQEDHYTYFLAYEQGQLIGYCGVKPEVDGRLFLSKLYLHKDSRGKGLSSSLMKEALHFAQESNMHAIYLTCNKYNTHSLDVYRRKGFYEIDAVTTDIGQGYIMDDYILQLDLN